MANNIAWYPPDIVYYEIVIKCAGDQMLMRPDEKTTWIIADVLGHVVRKHDIPLYAVACVSTHGHLIVGSRPELRLDKVQQDLKSQLAKRLNVERDRIGVFFQRKKPIPILSTEAFFDRLRYTHAQPVHHGMVERVEDWPGLSSFRAVVEGKPSIEASWFDERSWRDAGADPTQKAAFLHVATVPITPPPEWDGLTDEQLRFQRAAHEESVRDREREQAAARGTSAPPPPEPSHYRQVDPFSRPVGPIQRRPAPIAHGSADEVAEYRRRYRIVVAAHREASAQYRATGKLCPFPLGTFPPRIEVPFETA
jgi:hypothetical protein